MYVVLFLNLIFHYFKALKHYLEGKLKYYCTQICKKYDIKFKQLKTTTLPDDTLSSLFY